MGDAVLVFPAGGRRGLAQGAAPLEDAIELVYTALAERAAAARTPAFWPALPPKPPLSLVERAGLFRLMHTLPDACGELEISAFVEAMRHAPAGDLVDIGAGLGSASVLMAWLGQRYDVGPVLSIDTWRGEACPPADDAALRAFQINVAPFAAGRLNYERAAPGAACAAYGPEAPVRTPAFGETRYRGQVAMLRIGGAVAADAEACAAWMAHVAPGGWIVFGGDDRADLDACAARAEVFSETDGAHICATFRAGMAIFMQLKRVHG